MPTAVIDQIEPQTQQQAIQIRLGYELIYEFPQPTPLNLMLRIHPTRERDIVIPDVITTEPNVPLTEHRDSFGNRCTRLLAPAGQIRIAGHAIVRDGGGADEVAPWASQVPVQDLPDDALQFLSGSRYCETDHLSQIAWNLFGNSPSGWARVQAIIDFVHSHIRFGYEHARPTKTAWEAFNEGTGVCRDFAHLAVAFCRCMNIPARYCTGYLGDIGVPPNDAPMDFAGWFEAYLGGRWFTFDPRNYVPRIGRVLIARGRDAADVAISTSFGPSCLTKFQVWTDQI
jgi:transglutaminase-like putative cysteine protease